MSLAPYQFSYPDLCLTLPLRPVFQSHLDILIDKSQHRKLTLEKRILPQLLLEIEPRTFWSWVWHSTNWAILTLVWHHHLDQSQHRKLTLEKKILPQLLLEIEPRTFWSWVWHSTSWAILTLVWHHHLDQCFNLTLTFCFFQFHFDLCLTNLLEPLFQSLPSV